MFFGLDFDLDWIRIELDLDLQGERDGADKSRAERDSGERA